MPKLAQILCRHISKLKNYDIQYISLLRLMFYLGRPKLAILSTASQSRPDRRLFCTVKSTNVSQFKNLQSPNLRLKERRLIEYQELCNYLKKK